jgi:hypothetical protein
VSDSQIVILTILAISAIVTFMVWMYRMVELEDSLWIEPLILSVIFLFAYLVGGK